MCQAHDTSSSVRLRNYQTTWLAKCCGAPTCRYRYKCGADSSDLHSTSRWTFDAPRMALVVCTIFDSISGSRGEQGGGPWAGADGGLGARGVAGVLLGPLCAICYTKLCQTSAPWVPSADFRRFFFRCRCRSRKWKHLLTDCPLVADLQPQKRQERRIMRSTTKIQCTPQLIPGEC